LPNIGEFRENRLGDSHTLRNGVNEFLPVLRVQFGRYSLAGTVRPVQFGRYSLAGTV
jgi:hypothetical protein